MGTGLILKGLGCPNAQWRTFTKEEEAALLDLRPDGLLVLGYLDSPVFAEQLAEHARIWEALGKPKVILRPYAEGIPSFKPHEWALSCFLTLRWYATYGIHPEMLGANEWNIEAPADQREDWPRMVAWLTAFAREFKILSPDTPLHLPALSPATENYRDGLRYMADQGLGQLYDIIDLHCYTEAQLQDVLLAQGLFPGKPVVVTEVNSMAPSFYMPKLDSLGCEESYWFILSGTEDQRPYWLIGSPYYEDFQATGQGFAHDDGGGTMALKDVYPDAYAAWEAAGGVEDNFRAHLRGIGVLPPSVEGALDCLDRAEASVRQARAILGALPLA